MGLSVMRACGLTNQLLSTTLNVAVANVQRHPVLPGGPQLQHCARCVTSITAMRSPCRAGAAGNHLHDPLSTALHRSSQPKGRLLSCPDNGPSRPGKEKSVSSQDNAKDLTIQCFSQGQPGLGLMVPTPRIGAFRNQSNPSYRG